VLSALRHRNFRRYFAVQVVSNIGTWVQITVENWLVLELSHSALALGVTNALQFGPTLFLGMYGGMIADRCDRRRLLMITQACLGLLALLVGIAAGMGIIRVWMIWLAAGMLGLVKCFDVPALQSFVKDLVGPTDLPNAVAWTNTTTATGRMVGATAGGLMLVTLGAAPGFLFNAATFALVVIVLATLRHAELSPRKPVPSASGQVRQGLTYVVRQPVLAATSIMMIVVFASTYNFQISLALLASDTLGGTGETYGTLMSVLGLGIVTGSLILAHRARSGLPAILLCTCALAAAQLAVATMHSLRPMLAAIFAYGVCAGLFSVAVVSTLQSQTAEDMRGRVMAVYSICFNGCSLFGAPAFSAVAEWIGVSAALRITAGICATVALITALAWQTKRRVRVRPPTTPSSAPPPSYPAPCCRRG
jgi:predicted MFS family arabinose efflux permease